MKGQYDAVIPAAAQYKLPFGSLLKYIPGLTLLLLVGYTGKIVADLVPHTEYVIFAIAIGMVLANTISLPRVFTPGIKTYELWLKAGIVLMGAKLTWQMVLNIGTTGILLVTIEILISIFVARWLAHRFGLTERLGSLIGIGVGICGVSAIIGATGAIDAKEEDASYAIATILIFGAIMVFLYPLIGHLIGLPDTAFGYWAGLAVDNTAETIATGFAFSEAAGNVATIVKLSRNALMGFIILIFALYYANKGMAANVENKAHFLWVRFPKFLLGFLALSILTSLGFFGAAQGKAVVNMSKWFFLLTFAGVGLSLKFSKLKAGIKPFIVGLGVETVVSIMTLALILAFIA